MDMIWQRVAERKQRLHEQMFIFQILMLAPPNISIPPASILIIPMRDSGRPPLLRRKLLQHKFPGRRFKLDQDICDVYVL